MLKRYVSKYPSYSLTVRKNDAIVRVKFASGVFETEDPTVQEALEANQYYGSAFRLSCEKPEQKGIEKRRGHKQSRTNFDPLAAVVFEELHKDAGEDGEGIKEESP